MKNRLVVIVSLLLCSIGLLTYSCKEDDFSTNSDYRLSFSVDTISFDTVFTELVSTTARLKVYNRHKENIRISTIKKSNQQSPFKINVLGQTNDTQSYSNIELRAKDSLYIFVKVTIDPNNSNNPILFSDSIEFFSNNNLQYVQLRAVGQDVFVFNNKEISNDTTLTNQKPYLIYGNLNIAEGKNLTIEAGCKLYFHAKSGITLNGGNLVAEGTKEAPILLRGDRLDHIFAQVPYDSLPGQWLGITLNGGTHKLDQVEMKSGKNGIALLSGENNVAQINISNTTIHNFDSCGIVATNATIVAENSIISNCRERCLSLTGGSHRFTHCTVANYFPKIKRSTASLFLSNYKEMEAKEMFPLQADFNNCIIYGNNNSEISFDESEGALFEPKFLNCLIIGYEIEKPYFSQSFWMKENSNIFRNVERYPYDFRLIEESPARNIADVAIANSLPVDKIGNDRLADSMPDVGAFEYEP